MRASGFWFAEKFFWTVENERWRRFCLAVQV
jgi:hypothetical protein